MNHVLSNINAIDDSDTFYNFKCKIGDLKNIITVQNQDYTIISQNIRGIYANFDDFLANVSILDINPDLVILSECKLNIDKHIPQIIGYNSFQTSKHLNQSDGVVAYVKTTLAANVSEVYLKHASCLQISTPQLTVLGIYRSPSNRKAEQFIDSLCTHLELIKGTKNIIVTGDININLIYSNDEQSYERSNRLNYLEMLASQIILF